MSTVDDGRAVYRRDHNKVAKADDKPGADVYTFEALASDLGLRGRARYLARRDPAIRQTLADVDAAYRALGQEPGDDAA